MVVNRRYLCCISLLALLNLFLSVSASVQLDSNTHDILLEPSPRPQCIILEIKQKKLASFEPNEHIFIAVSQEDEGAISYRLCGFVRLTPGMKNVAISYDTTVPEYVPTARYRLRAYTFNLPAINNVLRDNNIDVYNIRKLSANEVNEKIVTINPTTLQTVADSAKQLSISDVISSYEISADKCSASNSSLNVTYGVPFKEGPMLGIEASIAGGISDQIFFVLNVIGWAPIIAAFAISAAESDFGTGRNQINNNPGLPWSI